MLEGEHEGNGADDLLAARPLLLGIDDIDAHGFFHVTHQEQRGQKLALLGVEVELFDDLRQVGPRHHPLVDVLDLLGGEGGHRRRHEARRDVRIFDQDDRRGGVGVRPEENGHAAQEQQGQGNDQRRLAAALQGIQVVPEGAVVVLGYCDFEGHMWTLRSFGRGTLFRPGEG